MPRQENAQSHINLMASITSKNKKSSGQLNLRSCRVSMILRFPPKKVQTRKEKASKMQVNAPKMTKLCLGEFCGRKQKNAGSSNVICYADAKHAGKAGTHLIKRYPCFAQ